MHPDRQQNIISAIFCNWTYTWSRNLDCSYQLYGLKKPRKNDKRVAFNIPSTISSCTNALNLEYCFRAPFQVVQGLQLCISNHTQLTSYSLHRESRSWIYLVYKSTPWTKRHLVNPELTEIMRASYPIDIYGVGEMVLVCKWIILKALLPWIRELPGDAT